MSEQKIQSKIIKAFEKEGCYIVNGIYTKKGIPDLIGCYRGMFFAVEVKRPSTKENVTPLQRHHLDTIEDIGGHSEVMWSETQVKPFLGDLDELRRK